MQASQSTANSKLTVLGIEQVVTTDEAAAVINRKPQTLRKWACLENGPIRPVRINGRLAWRVSDLRALIEGNEPRPIAA
ncbi:helix-turn-helix domain-containing protein [Paraburkholderia agricolaris]|uniref:Helix-turn-helix domain-containing protein n=1 Tax=Paraburkholderia agricolaris TaxID=2152888 RepID=A0ABW8ZPQ6_9BURK